MSRLFSTWIVLLSSSFGLADVTEWSGRSLGNDYDVIDNINVLIKANGTFKLQSVTDDELDVIGSITIAVGVTGTVTLLIARNPADEAGTDGGTHVGASDRDITINRDYAATAVVWDDARRAPFCASGSRPAPSL